ncbi:MAG TPA: hypothetical protein VFO10_18020 [Oligoflexus sp.]|uniref:hypothetical protein n=1 Tax=Oligoflexus sp. TaxID=1971216 RepID=UPI002D80289D|nr:hypothetical protein [Oligoflexus sp.]HET9239162.1 hypothetical protein [Oligoflexus sp.]
MTTLGLCLVPTAHAANIKIDWLRDESMAVARGYDSVTGEVRGDCITNAPVVPPSGAAGQVSRYELKLAENSRQLEESLNITAEASARAFIFGASSKTKFISSKNINSLSTFVIIRMQVLNPTQSMISPSISPLLLDVLKKEGAASFREKCGDYFVTGYTSGAEFIAILKLDSSTEQEKKDLSTSLSANMGIFSASAEFNDSFSKLKYKAKSELIVLQNGGDSEKSPIDLQGITDRASNMPVLALNKPIPISPILRPYDEIPEYISLVKQPFVLSEASNFIARVSAEIVRERNRFFTLNDILDSGRYVLGSSEQIKAYHLARHNVIANLNLLRSAYLSCSNTLFEKRVDNQKSPCQSDIQLKPSSFELPAKK